MRKFLVILVAAGLGLAFLAQKRSEQKTAQAQTARTEASAKADPAPRKVSEHNWAKHSLDRTNSVIQQVQQQRKENAPK